MRLICSVATESLPDQVDESKVAAPKEIFLKDYKMLDYYFDSVDLDFSSDEEKTIVGSKNVSSLGLKGLLPYWFWMEQILNYSQFGSMTRI
ncbi:hypothetical protein ACFX2H_015218 [Malus domestica]